MAPVRVSNPAFEILRTIEAAGHEALIVGGAVRDRVMGLSLKYADIATNMPVAELERAFRTHDLGKCKGFGLVAVP